MGDFDGEFVEQRGPFSGTESGVPQRAQNTAKSQARDARVGRSGGLLRASPPAPSQGILSHQADTTRCKKRMGRGSPLPAVFFPWRFQKTVSAENLGTEKMDWLTAFEMGNISFMTHFYDSFSSSNVTV